MGSLSKELRAKKTFDFYLKFILFFKRRVYFVFNYMYLCVYLCAYMYTWVQLPEEARKGLGTPWSWDCRQLWAAWHEHRETNSIPLRFRGGWEPSLQYRRLFFFFNGGNFMIYITNTIYISKQDTGMGLTIYSAFCVLLFIFSFTFCRLYSWRISSTYAMKYDHIRPSPSLPPTSC